MRCGTTRDERARDRAVRHPPGGVLYQSGAYARNVLCLTLGDLSAVPRGTEGGGSRSDRSAEVSRGQSRSEAGKASEAPQCRKAGQRIGRAATRVTEGPNGGGEQSLHVETRESIRQAARAAPGPRGPWG